MDQQADWIEQHLSLFNKLFHGDSSAFTLIRGRDTKVQFRVPVDQRNLRINKSRVRTLHNGAEIGEWIIVGKVTAVPNQYEDSPFGQVDAEESEHMRDHFRSMMGSVQEVLRQIHESEMASEVVIFPLAVYQETSVAVSDSE